MINVGSNDGILRLRWTFNGDRHTQKNVVLLEIL